VGRIDDPEGIPIVKQHDRNRARGLGRLGAGLMLVGASVAAGCGNPEAGTAQVTPEARKQALPHVTSEPKGRGFKPAAGKSFSIKDRATAPSQP
jgi:hypothetical protein